MHEHGRRVLGQVHDAGLVHRESIATNRPGGTPAPGRVGFPNNSTFRKASRCSNAEDFAGERRGLLADCCWRTWWGRTSSCRSFGSGTRGVILRWMSGITEAADGIPGDPLNVALIGREAEVLRSMQAAHWDAADALGLRGDLKIAADTVLRRQYDEGEGICSYPVSRNTRTRKRLQGGLLGAESFFPGRCFRATHCALRVGASGRIGSFPANRTEPVAQFCDDGSRLLVLVHEWQRWSMVVTINRERTIPWSLWGRRYPSRRRS